VAAETAAVVRKLVVHLQSATEVQEPGLRPWDRHHQLFPAPSNAKETDCGAAEVVVLVLALGGLPVKSGREEA
jgi:hypothetical protein